jgi:hypothetical protein
VTASFNWASAGRKRTLVRAMGRLTWITIGCLAIAANLLVPQRLISYRACCYGEDGRLLADSQMHCKDLSAPVRISGPDCCAPEECQLRPTAPSDSVAPEMPPPGNADQSPALVADVTLPSAMDAPLSRRFPLDTGPPGAAAILSLHSRLNL